MKHNEVLMSKDVCKLKTGKWSSWLSDLSNCASKMPENSRGNSHFLPTVKVGMNFSIFATLLMVISASSTISAINSCNKGRYVMNSTWGIITNGPENYREDSYCVWLVKGIYEVLLII